MEQNLRSVSNIFFLLILNMTTWDENRQWRFKVTNRVRSFKKMFMWIPWQYLIQNKTAKAIFIKIHSFYKVIDSCQSM